MRRGHSGRPAAELGMRPEDWAWGNGGRKEELPLASLFPQSECPMGAQGVRVAVGVSGRAMGRGGSLEG